MTGLYMNFFGFILVAIYSASCYRLYYKFCKIWDVFSHFWSVFSHSCLPPSAIIHSWVKKCFLIMNESSVIFSSPVAVPLLSTWPPCGWDVLCGLITPGQWWKSWLSTRLPLTPPQWGNGTLLLWQMGMEIQVSLWPYYHLAWWKSQLSAWPSLTAAQLRGGGALL